jgi:cation diffusion facilitator family transporter
MTEDFSEMARPGIIALVAAVVTIVLKAILFTYKRGVAKKINSGALMADAWHHLSDSLSSIGSFLGILGARLGFPFLDPAAAILICLFIFKVALDVFREAVGKMTDHACEDNIVEEIRTTALSHEGVLSVDEVKTRLFGDKFYLDIEISVDGSQTLFDAHIIAKQLHDVMEAKFDNLKHCMVHVNPHGEIHE